MRFIVISTFLFLLNTAPALAACSLPDGQGTRPEGQVVYNSNYAVLQVCSGGVWRALHGFDPAGVDTGSGGGDACETGAIGTVCTSDGAVYAGDTVGGARMYLAAADESGPIAWGGYGNNDGTGSTADGLANTNTLIADGHGHPAAQACRNRGADWYLPAKDELSMIYSSRAQLDTANLPTGTGEYWSSTENNDSLAWSQRFSDGFQYYYGKGAAHPVRCVRR